MHTHGTKDDCLSFEQWSGDFFSNTLQCIGFKNQVIELESIGKFQFVVCHCWHPSKESNYKPILFK